MLKPQCLQPTNSFWCFVFVLFWLCQPSLAVAQSVCLPAPRLLTTMPMGGRAGSRIELVVSGQNIDEGGDLHFSHPGITATPQLSPSGGVVSNRFLVAIAEDTPAGLYEARLMTRLGLSSSRVFSVGTLSEVTREQANTSLATALEIKIGSICNAVTTTRSIDHFAFRARQGQRIVVHCLSRGIESKLNPVLIVGDAQGNDLRVERRGAPIDFIVPADGRYIIKVHDLTFHGGAAYFYRLAVQEIAAESTLPRFPSVKTVSSFSWPPKGLAGKPESSEQEPNNTLADAERLALPCDVAGSFFPAADVDTFEFLAKKGEVWWVEVASERLGLPTDPSILVQHVVGAGSTESLTDVAELTDIASPVKPSSNRYAYDGPPYDGGSPDILAKLTIKEDGLHRLQLRDLFGGTRSDPDNVYRLVIRKAAPDFALVAWGLHMALRNGDRNALSKPISLRGGATIALEVVAVRRDGFQGEIELVMDGVPDGVSATGLRIPAGKSRGIMLITAEQDAPRSFSSASFYGRARIGEETVTRRCQLASMAWPVADAWQEIPSPRLLADVPISVSGSEFAPITIAPLENKIWEVIPGQKLTIPLVHTLRSEFSGSTIGMRTFGCGFDGMGRFDLPLKVDRSEAVLDLTTVKTPPGQYQIAFYGGAVVQYRYDPEGVKIAEIELQRAEHKATALSVEAKQRAEEAASAPPDQKAAAETRAAELAQQQTAAASDVESATKRLKLARDRAKPRDIAEIVVSEPILIRVKSGDTK